MASLKLRQIDIHSPSFRRQVWKLRSAFKFLFLRHDRFAAFPSVR